MATGGAQTRKFSGMSLGRWWTSHVVAGVDHQDVLSRVREDAGWSSHFAFMTLMSAGIAILGLLLSSPAVVIGAMLISPLMGPIIGLGFAMATFDGGELRRAGTALLIGIVAAILFCTLIVMVSPLQTVTVEISARTRPNLFDLLVALFSGLAGTYAMIRGRHGAIVGVAIATALMPPLAVIGFGLATWNMAVLGGSTLLFFTNLMTIAASAAVLARIYGFANALSPQQTRLQAAIIIISLAALAVPLAVSLRQIAWEAFASREAKATIAAEFPDKSRVSELIIDYQGRPIEITGTVLTPQYREGAENNLRIKLGTVLHEPVNISIDQIRTASQADSAALIEAQGRSAAQRNAARLAERLALVAGVPTKDVMVDRVAQRALVRAAVLPGAEMRTYRELEQRAAATASGWNIVLIPPPAPLGDVMRDGEINAAALDTAIWAARRLRVPLGVVAERRADAETIAQRLDEAGIRSRILARDVGPGRVALEWQAPGSAQAGDDRQVPARD